jgi:hypothetical protein
MSKLYLLADLAWTATWPLVLLLLMVGCAPRPELDPPADEAAGAATVSPGMACGALFAAGVATPPAAASVLCETATGPLLVPSIPCKDGGALWQVSGPGVKVAGWGRAGQPFNATDDLQDPAWLAALADCTGGA